jgi:hypothetical protein
VRANDFAGERGTLASGICEALRIPKLIPEK